jgi:carboxylesterase
MSEFRQLPVQFFSEPEHQPFRMGSGGDGVLLIHGFMGTPAEMRPLGERLAGLGYDVTGILLPGFGPDIPNLANVTRHDWLEAAGEAWHAVRRSHPRALLAGYSMGAAVALHLAADLPPDGLLLFAPFWRMDGWMFRVLPVAKHVIRSVAPFEKANFDDPAVRAQLEGLAPGIDLADPETQRFLREEVRLPLATLDEVVRLGRAAYKRAGQVHAPALVVQGTGDVTVTPAATRELAGRLKGPVTPVEVSGGHDIIRLEGQAGDATLAAVSRFLAARPQEERPALSVEPMP